MKLATIAGICWKNRIWRNKRENGKEKEEEKEKGNFIAIKINGTEEEEAMDLI